jgi:hypothetical protein
MEFAEYLPSSCPPDTAVPARGEFFRMAWKVPLTKKMFEPHLYRKGPDQFEERLRCQAAGLSVYLKIEDAIKAIEEAAPLNPLARKSVLVKATVDAGWGVMKHTPKDGNSHHTWWVAKDRTPHELFELVVS